MKKPDFFIVGAPKCGTSAMYTFLRQHPDVFMPSVKEPQFFGSDLINTSRFIHTVDQYVSLFEGASDEKRIGEASTTYLYSKIAAAEIKEFSPSARIIVMLRNPVELMYTLHNNLVIVGYEHIHSFEEALGAEEKRKQGLLLPPRPGMVAILFYREVAQLSSQVVRYLDRFDRDNIHFIVFDDFKSDVRKVYRETLRFLGVSEDFEAEFEIVNPSARIRSKFIDNFLVNPPQIVRSVSSAISPLWLRRRLFFDLRRLNTSYGPLQKMDVELKRRLQEEFAPEVERLGALVDRDLQHWLQ